MHGNASYVKPVPADGGRSACWRVALDSEGGCDHLLTQTICFTREGFSVQVDQPLPQDRPLTAYLEIPLGERTTTLKLDSLIAAPAADGTAPPYRYDLRFDHLPPRQALTLDRALVELESNGARRHGAS